MENSNLSKLTIFSDQVENTEKIYAQNDSWIEIQTEFLQKKAELKEKINKKTDFHKIDIINELCQTAEKCGDIKNYWNIEFPCKLREKIRYSILSLCTDIDKEMTEIQKWLTDTIRRQFGIKAVSFANGVDIPQEQEIEIGQERSHLKNRNIPGILIFTGYAASFGAAAVLLYEPDTLNILISALLLCGAGAQIFKTFKNRTDREKIVKKIPNIVDKQFSKNLSFLDKSQENAFQAIYETIEKMKKDFLQVHK